MREMVNRFRRPPLWAVQLAAQVTQIQKQIGKLMALVQIEQSDLDTLAGNLEAVKTSLAAEIASLQTQLPQADLSGVKQAVADLTALEPPAPSA
jgi:hypothetical protein